VRNSHFTLRIEIVGAFPTLVWGLWPSLLGTGISYNRGYRLETVTLSEMFMPLHKTKCCAFQHFQVILPTYLKKEHIVKYMQITRMYILLNRWATRQGICGAHKPGPPLSENGVLDTPRKSNRISCTFDSRTSAIRKYTTIHTKCGVEY
jgi:hypothetical protein